jgi:hypothetical protein
VGGRLELHPWDYTHEARSERETRRIEMTAPARWVLSYGAEYDLARMKRAVSGREQGQPEFIHQFVMLALTLRLVIARSAPVVDLLAALRFRVAVEPVAELHNLPVAAIEFALPSFRPPDELILTATALSGVPAFIELIDVEEVRNIPDPIKARIESLVS